MHHANIIISRKDCKNFVFSILQRDLNFDIKANPDFLMIENESFSIDNARDFGKWAIGKPLLGESKVSLIVTKSITHEAQNALLKILEEPSLGTYIFIKLESQGGLLPTFLSRVRILSVEDEDFENNISNENENKNNADKFLRADIRGKFSLIQSLSKKVDKTDMKELIKDLEKISYENYTKDISKAKAMKNMLKAKIFATSRGSSPKILLEWLSCVV